MILNITFIIIGLALLLFGANILTDGASAVAKRFHLSEFVIGLTIVALGTSAPELIVSVLSAIEGQGDVAIGNILGSNLFNILIILGVTSLIMPLNVESNTLKKDIPFGLLSTVVLGICACDMLFESGAGGVISHSEGWLLLCFFGIFMAYTILSAKTGQPGPEPSPDKKKEKPLWLNIAMIAGGLTGLIFGGELFLKHAAMLARTLGVSESVIAITLMAGGTSLPELVSCIVAALRGKPQMALGNVIGSNIANIFLILGISASITPLSLGNILPSDMLVLIGASLLLFITAFTFKKRQIDRIEGILFILLYIGYIYWLLKR